MPKTNTVEANRKHGPDCNSIRFNKNHLCSCASRESGADVSADRATGQMERQPRSTFTPGPWAVEIDRGGASTLVSYDTGPESGAICKLYGSGEEKQANARLIAAAPELLEACKHTLTSLVDLHPKMRASISKLVAAIAKAEGRS